MTFRIIYQIESLGYVKVSVDDGQTVDIPVETILTIADDIRSRIDPTRLKIQSPGGGLLTTDQVRKLVTQINEQAGHN